jgi:hypothetical protein
MSRVECRKLSNSSANAAVAIFRVTTATIAETMNNFQRSTRIIPEGRSCTLNFSHENVRSRSVGSVSSPPMAPWNIFGCLSLDTPRGFHSLFFCGEGWPIYGSNSAKIGETKIFSNNCCVQKVMYTNFKGTDFYLSRIWSPQGMMEAARTSETLVNFYQTIRRYNPEDSHPLDFYLFTNPLDMFDLIVPVVCIPVPALICILYTCCCQFQWLSSKSVLRCMHTCFVGDPDPEKNAETSFVPLQSPGIPFLQRCEAGYFVFMTLVSKNFT